MSAPVLPPNPSLLAILLIARTGEGLKRIFQYPPVPGNNKYFLKCNHKHRLPDDSTSSSDDEPFDPMEDYFSSDEEGRSRRRCRASALDSVPPAKESDKVLGKRAPKHWESYLGLPPDFDQILCPPSSHHKKRFELGFEELVFVGWPVFAYEDGKWRKKKKRSSSGLMRRMSTISEQAVLETNDGKIAVEIDHELGETTGNESTDHAESGTEFAPVDSIENPALPMQAEELKARSSGSTLNMFNVVFVMNPPVLEYQLRVDDMYKHVVKKFARALKWEQGRSNFVQRECEKLRAMKAKRDPSSQQILRASPLARSIATLYASISSSRIAHIELTPRLSFSLQIPNPASLSSLPDLISPQLSGLPLTTAHHLPPSESDLLPSTLPKVASHFALLLLVDAATLFAELASPMPTPADPTPMPSPLAGPLSNYLHHTTPTKSFHQVSQASGIPLADVHFLAAHLIYWRKARAIPPLHQRNVYVASPNADGRRLTEATAQYARLFPAPLPSLPKMLALLGAAGPRPYSAVIPSKDHKPVYFDILAWLLRGGWVVQLRAFGRVRVPGAIQEQVLHDEHAAGSTEKSTPTAERGTAQHEPEPASAGSGHPPRPSSPLASSLASTRTAIPLAHRHARPPPRPAAAATPKDPPPAHPLPPPVLILHPTRAAGLEARQLAAVAAEVEARGGHEAREAWDRCVRYLDGAHALEQIAVREGWKRKAVDGWRAMWVRMGVLVEVRHW